MSFDERIEQWQAVKDNAERFCFVSADLEWQRTALEDLEALIQHFESYIKEAIADSTLSDDIADSYYCCQQALLGIRDELHMWIAIREQRHHQAWDHLISAQHRYYRLCATCPMLTKLDRRYVLLECLERIMFPPQVFMSPGMIGKYKCSICGQSIEDCDHIRGRLYRGQPCYYIAVTPELREVSIVNVPVDKRRRIFSYSNGETTIDKLTNGPVRSKPS